MVGAVVVLYNPDNDQLKRSLVALSPQVDKIFLIDNSAGNYQSLYSGYSNTVYIPLMKNIGIAAAQNIRIKYCKEQKCDFVFFSDQDSIATHNVVSGMLSIYECMKDRMKIAAIGPLPINRQTRKYYLCKASIIRKYDKKETGCFSDVYEMYDIISSFSLVPIKNFETVGLMEEELFIDCVELEWLWYASYKYNMKTLLVTDITISHQKGEGDHPFLGKQICISTPFRIYYQFRNFIILRRRAYVPAYWRKSNQKKFIMKLIYYPLFVSPRIQYLKRIILAIKDGYFHRPKSYWR